MENKYDFEVKIQELQAEIQANAARAIYHVELAQKQAQTIQNVQAGRATLESGNGSKSGPPEPARASQIDRLGRNDLCWCGSGKKYKHCHYREDQKSRQTVNQKQVKRSVKRRR